MIYLRIGRSSINSLLNISRGFWISHVPFSTSSKKSPLKTTTSFEFLLHKHSFSPTTVSEIAPVLTHIRNPQNCASTLSFLNEYGFSNHQLETIVRRNPNFLVAQLETNIKPKIKTFQDLGLTPCDISELILKNPWILHPSKNKIDLSLSVLKGLVGSGGEVAKLLRSNGWYLTKDLSKSLVPNVEYLLQCGVPLEQIIKFTYTFPRYLLSDPEVIKKHVERADRMGVDRSSRMFIHAVRVISSMSDATWNMKLQAFRDIGFSEDDISRVFRQAPVMFVVSVPKMMRVKDIVVATGKYNISSITRCPSLLGRSIEGWYKPRLLILGILESKKLISSWPSLATMNRMSNIRFFEKFVAPHFEEVGNLYMENISSSDRKEVEDLWSESQIGLKNTTLVYQHRKKHILVAGSKG